MKTKVPKSDLRRFEQLLHERRQAVESQLEKLLGRSEAECALALNEDVFSEKEESMLAELDAGFEAEVHRLRGTLSGIEAALRRHANATYGVCVECGGPIAVEHLNREPEAACCESCGKDADHGVGSKVA